MNDTVKRILALCAVLLLAVLPLSARTPSPAPPGPLTVKGHVSDSTGVGLVGVTIVEAGTNNASSTDISGDYTIKVSDGESARLEFYFVGMQTVTVSVSGRSRLDVIMKEEVTTLESVVVTGYSTISKESYTGSAITVTAQKLEDRPIASLEEAFRGNVTGALTASSGQPGEGGSLILRGFGSMNASNQPLYVVDGVVWDQANVSGTDNAVSNPLNALNPSDIASMTILKDAASASLYGSRGANGVVVITTRQGLTGEKIRVNLSTVNGFSYMTGQPSLTTGEEYAELWTEGQMNFLIQSDLAKTISSSSAVRSRLVEEVKALYADKSGYRYNGRNYYEWMKLAQQDFNAKYQMPTSNGGYRNYDYFCDDADKLPSTDWFKAISRVAPFSKTSLSLRGGGSAVNYYASMEYFNQQGTIINSQLERYSMRMRLNSDARDHRVNWGINTYAAYTMQSGPMAGGQLYSSPQYAATILPSVVPAFLEDGSYNLAFPDNLLNSTNNPVASARVNINDRPTINFNIIGDLSIRLSDWLKFTTKASVYYYSYRRKTYQSSEFGTGYTTKGSLLDRNVQRRKLTNSSMLIFDKKWRSGHTLNASAGIELEDLLYQYQTMTVQGFASDDYPYISNSANMSSYGGAGYSYALFSLISRADYAYRSKYLLGASFRRDYSSLFSPEHRAGNFWSVSAGYDLTKEKFMRPYRRNINQMKFKASYGVNGTLPTEYYYWQDLYQTVRYNDQLGAYASYRPRPDLTWEGNRVFNVGFDGSFFRNRLDVTLEYYRRVSNNLLQDVRVSMVSGFQTMLMNTDAGIRNTGLEATVNATLIKKKAFSWDLGFNIARMRSVYYGLDSQYLDGYSRQLIANGVNVHTWYLREYAQVDPDTGMAMYYAYDEDGTRYMTTSSSEAPWTYDKQGVPKVIGGITNAVQYKGFQLDVLMAYGLGHYIYDRLGSSIISNDGCTNYAISRSQLDRWTPENIFSENPMRLNNAALTTRSTRYLVKGDYLKIKNIKLSYKVPSNTVQKLGLGALSIFVQAENPLVFGPLGDYDPEMSTSGYRFADLYPTATTYTLGLNIRF